MDYKRRARIALSAFFFLHGVCFASWTSRIPAIQESLQLGEAELGSVLLAIPVGSLISLPIAGWLIAKIGSRPVMITAALLYAALLCLIGWAPSVWALVACLFFFGFMGNMGNVSTNTQAVGLEMLYGRTIMSSFHAIWSLAGLAGASIGTLMVNLHLAPLQHFLVVAALVLVVILVSAKHTLHQSGSKTSKQPFFVKPDHYLLILGIIAFSCMICEGAMYDWSGVYFAKEVKVSPNKVTIGFTAYTLATTSGRIAGDWIAQKLGAVKLLVVSGILSAGGLVLSVMFPTVIFAALGFFLVGLGVSNIIPMVYSRAGKSTSMQPSMAIASVSTLGFMGFLTGPPLIGFVAGASSLRISFGIIACMGILIIIMAKKLK